LELLSVSEPLPFFVRPPELVESIPLEKVTLLPLVSTRIAEELFLIREEISAVMPLPYCSPPLLKVTFPEVPSALAFPITTVPVLREVGPV
jgi:hypothetical protein